MAPLRIGILGAAKIAPPAMIKPARKVDDAMQKNVGGMLGGKIPGF